MVNLIFTANDFLFISVTAKILLLTWECSCKDPESVVVVHVPSPCGCQKKIVPVTHYIVQEADPRDYMQNEPYQKVYGTPAEDSVSEQDEVAFGQH